MIRSITAGVASSILTGLLCAAALVANTAMAQAMYRIKPIGSLGECPSSVPMGVVGLNNADQVVGTACNSRGQPHAFLWRNDGNPRVDLGPAEWSSTSYGTGINASGQVSGWAQDSSGTFGFVASGDGKPMRRIYNSWGGTSIRANALNDLGQVTGSAQIASPYNITDAFVWTNVVTPMLDLENYKVLGRIYSAGTAINSSGQVAGYAGDNDRSTYGFVWKNDGSPVADLGGLGGYRTWPCCINASGQVAGTSSVSGFVHYHAFLWSHDGTNMRDLGTLARGSLSRANALNDSGQVAGWSTTFFENRKHAFVWLNDGTAMKDLGTFGGTISAAIDINASGQVTGHAFLAGDTVSHAFLWRHDGTTKQDLNALIDPLDPLQSHVTLTEGMFINDQGNIVAYGTDIRTGSSSPYLLEGTVLTLSPRSLAFGKQPVNTVSAAKSVTVTNTSARSVAITSIVLAGSHPGQFASTRNCGRYLAGRASCAIAVTFRPTSKGDKSAVLKVNGGGGGLRSVTLSGTGL